MSGYNVRSVATPTLYSDTLSLLFTGAKTFLHDNHLLDLHIVNGIGDAADT